MALSDSVSGPRAVGIIVAAAAVLVVLIWALQPRGTGQEDLPPEPPPLPSPTPAPEEKILLLFVGEDGRLHPELRSVPLPEELEQKIRVVLSELFAGSTEDLLPVAPWQIQLEAVYLDGAGNAFVDLSPPPAPLTGSHTELMLAYGIVDSILLNCPQLRGVQLLFGGSEVHSLAGHLDLSRPLVLNKQIIATS